MTGGIEEKWIGQRMVDRGIITAAQRDKVLEIQAMPENKNIRFGDIAIAQGYCTEEEIESMGGFLGEILVAEKVLTQEQLNMLLERQNNMRKTNLYVPTVGELAVIYEYCNKQTIESAILRNRHGKRDTSKPVLPDESSEW